MECKGFLFDLDGTLVDSLPAVERAWCHWANRFGIAHDEVLGFIHGKQAITSLRHFMAGHSEDEIMAEVYRLGQKKTRDNEGIVALPGAPGLLKHLNEARIPWAIVTSGSIPVASPRRGATGLPE
ncbi:HAD hydrolase-like protein, partial [Cronobacter sakazakii]|nr:HAD hydrolase-like protein [Cronobacter sakazakii]